MAVEISVEARVVVPWRARIWKAACIVASWLGARRLALWCFDRMLAATLVTIAGRKVELSREVFFEPSAR